MDVHSLQICSPLHQAHPDDVLEIVLSTSTEDIRIGTTATTSDLTFTNGQVAPLANTLINALSESISNLDIAKESDAVLSSMGSRHTTLRRANTAPVLSRPNFVDMVIDQSGKPYHSGQHESLIHSKLAPPSTVKAEFDIVNNKPDAIHVQGATT